MTVPDLQESSEDTFRTALAAHLANLDPGKMLVRGFQCCGSKMVEGLLCRPEDPESRITTAVVSVSSALSIVRCAPGPKGDSLAVQGPFWGEDRSH